MSVQNKQLKKQRGFMKGLENQKKIQMNEKMLSENGENFSPQISKLFFLYSLE